MHIEISTELCPWCSSSCTLYQKAQQPGTIKPCFNFLNTLPVTNESACSIRIYLFLIWQPILQKRWFINFDNIRIKLVKIRDPWNVLSITFFKWSKYKSNNEWLLQNCAESDILIHITENWHVLAGIQPFVSFPSLLGKDNSTFCHTNTADCFGLRACLLSKCSVYMHVAHSSLVEIHITYMTN